MKIKKFLLFYVLLLVSSILLSCGGGGGGQTVGGGSVTPSGEQLVGIPELGSMDQSIPVEQGLESLSFEELMSTMESETTLSADTFSGFLENYLTKKSLFLSEEDKTSLKEKFFGSGNGTLQDVDIDRIVEKSVSLALINQLPTIESLESATDMKSIMNQSKLTEDEWKDLSRKLRVTMKSLPSPHGVLDKNGDGKVDSRDYVRMIQPHYDPSLSDAQIQDAYYYWSYFSAPNDSWFKERMWKSNQNSGDQDLLPPPVMIFPRHLASQNSLRKIVILDFRGHLILKLSSIPEAQTLLKKVSYFLPFKIEDLSKPIYFATPVEHASSSDITIDKVIIQNEFKDNKPIFKMTLWIKDNNPLKQGALVLTPSLWLLIKESKKTSALQIKKRLGQYFSMSESQAADPEMVTPLEALDPGFAWQKLDQILKDIGWDISPEKDTASSDFSSANFTPPLPVSIQADVALSRALIEEEHSRIEKKVMELINHAGACGKQYNSSNECNLDQLLDALFKLNSHISEYMKFIYLYLLDVRNLYDDLSHSQDRILDGKQADQKEFEFDMKALVVAQILEFALTAVKSTASTISEKISETYVSGTVEAGIQLMIGKLADLLEMFSNAVAKEGATKAAVNLEKLAELARHIAKLEHAGAIHKGMSLMMSFGVALVKEYVKEAHEKAQTLYNNSATTLDANMNYQLSLIAQFEDFHSFLADKESSVAELMDHAKSVLNQTIINRFDAQKSCKETYSQALQELKEQHEQDLKDLESSLSPEKAYLEKAQKADELFNQACEHQLFKIEMTRDSMKTNCIETYEEVGCKKALARVDEAKSVYDEKLRCANADAPSILALNAARDRLERKKQELETQKSSLKQKMDDEIATLESELGSCKQSSVNGCLAKAMGALAHEGAGNQPKGKNILNSFANAREIIEGLSIKCASNIIKVFPPNGSFTSCQSAYENGFSTQQQTNAYIVLDQPVEYDQIDRQTACEYLNKEFSDYGFSLSADKRLILIFSAHNLSMWPYDGLTYWYSNGLYNVRNDFCTGGSKSAHHGDSLRYALSKCGPIQGICSAGSGYFSQPGAFGFPYEFGRVGVAPYQVDVSIYNQAVSSSSKSLLAKQTLSVPQGYCDKSSTPPTPEIIYMSYENQDGVSIDQLDALEFFFSNQIQPATLEITLENLGTGQSKTLRGEYRGDAAAQVYVNTQNMFQSGSRYRITVNSAKEYSGKVLNLNYSVTLSTR